MPKQDVIWCERGLFPVHFGFCPSQKAWDKEMERLGKITESYPTSHGKATPFKNKDTGSVCGVLVTVSEDRKRTVCQVVGLLVHESVHVWQEVLKSMGEDKPSSEFEAYALQHIFSELLEAYMKTRRKIKWQTSGR